MAFKAPAHLMVEHPILGMGSGNNGFFKIKYESVLLYVQSSDGAGWEHVSVSLNKSRPPTWQEMCYIKDLFWSDDDCVVQYHPPKSDYINNAENCLHLWRPVGISIPRPHYSLVGVK